MSSFFLGSLDFSFCWGFLSMGAFCLDYYYWMECFLESLIRGGCMLELDLVVLRDYLVLT